MGTVINLHRLAIADEPVSASRLTSPLQVHLPLYPKSRVSFAQKNRAGTRSTVVMAHVAVRGANLYDLLELSPDVGLSDIKKAYRQLARRYHPDVCPNRSEESTRRFIEIQEAYETLSDPRRRAVYDHAVAMGRGSASRGRMPWSRRDRDGSPLDWRTQWENQLFDLRRHSTVRAQDTWAARVRRQNGM